MIMDDKCGCACFIVEFEDEEEFVVEFDEVIMVEHGYDPFAGPYEVIPKAWDKQILATKGKNMTDDVTVHEVPYSEVTNPEGRTVVIAS